MRRWNEIHQRLALYRQNCRRTVYRVGCRGHTYCCLIVDGYCQLYCAGHSSVCCSSTYTAVDCMCTSILLNACIANRFHAESRISLYPMPRGWGTLRLRADTVSCILATGSAGSSFLVVAFFLSLTLYCTCTCNVSAQFTVRCG